MSDARYNEYVDLVKFAVALDSRDMLSGIYSRILYEEGAEGREIVLRLDKFYNYKWSGMI